MTTPARLIQGLMLTAVTGTGALAADAVDLTFERTLPVAGVDVPYALQVKLSKVDLTRVGLDAALDLRDVQAAISTRFDGDVVVDICNARVSVAGLELKAQDEYVSFEAGASAAFFACARESLRVADRGERLFDQEVTVRATMSAQLEANCIRFELADAGVTLTGALEPTAEQQAYLDQARALFLSAMDRVLSNHPLCVDLPPELATLEPVYRAGGTVELGQGGIGVYFQGSVEVSTAAILDVLQVLQDGGVLPPPP